MHEALTYYGPAAGLKLLVCEALSRGLKLLGGLVTCGHSVRPRGRGTSSRHRDAPCQIPKVAHIYCLQRRPHTSAYVSIRQHTSAAHIYCLQRSRLKLLLVVLVVVAAVVVVVVVVGER